MSVPAPTTAVFLSYAHEDADAARRLAEALRAEGLTVWFDEDELRGGDAWDRKIRQQIDGCALFVPIISRHTEARAKGYFRLEWKLAVDQTHLLAEGVPYLAPVAVDDTREASAMVPAEFCRVQWTRLPGGIPTPAFVEQIKRLLEKTPSAGITAPPMPMRAASAVAPASPPESARAAGQPASPPPTGSRFPATAVLAVVAIVVGGLAVYYATRGAAPVSAAPVANAGIGTPSLAARKTAAETPAPSAKSIAVLPFDNFSPDPENAYFADGMHDEVITTLSKIHDLTVISRTSVMAFKKAEGRNLKKIAAELGVASVLEGSVQRANGKVKVIAQLIDARSDKHLWAETYIEDATDGFTIQSKLAAAITTALKATLSPAEKSVIERRPTENQQAYDLYLRARQLNGEITAAASRERWDEAIRLLDEAIALDPAFVPALAMRAVLHQRMYWFGNVDPTPARWELSQLTLAALQAAAPNAPETAFVEGFAALNRNLDFPTALRLCETAQRGLPNWDLLLRLKGWILFNLGRFEEGFADCRRAQTLNPLDLQVVANLSTMNLALRRFEACIAASGQFAGSNLLTYSNGGDAIERARFELSGDREALARNLATLATNNPRVQLQADYESALVRGDLARAADCLKENPAGMLTWNGAAVEPVSLNQALVARLMGRPAEAAAYAEQAKAYLRERKNSYRQNNFTRIQLIRALAYGGRDEEALRLAKVAQLELAPVRIGVSDGAAVLNELGRLYALLGAREEALGCLRVLTSGPNSTSGFGTPRLVRLDPCWSRLKDDPRFEEILKSAKPL